MRPARQGPAWRGYALGDAVEKGVGDEEAVGENDVRCDGGAVRNHRCGHCYHPGDSGNVHPYRKIEYIVEKNIQNCMNPFRK